MKRAERYKTRAGDNPQLSSPYREQYVGITAFSTNPRTHRLNGRSKRVEQPEDITETYYVAETMSTQMERGE